MSFYKKAATQGDVYANYVSVSRVLVERAFRITTDSVHFSYLAILVDLKGEMKCERKPEQALIYLNRSAQLADETCSDGAYLIGMLNTRACDDIRLPTRCSTPDEVEAVRHFTIAADLGHIKACTKLAFLCEYGCRGCQANPAASIKYYMYAADRGDAEAQIALSGWYLKVDRKRRS